jgi:hypothetical protein
MTRSPVSVVLCLLGLLIAIGLAGCGGTETGNPAGPGGGGERNPAAELSGAICDLLTDCFGQDEGFTKEDCEEAIAENEALGAAFGLEEEPPPEYAQVIDQVEENELSANEEAVDECVEEIQSLGCEDPDVLEVDTQAGFSNVEVMVPEAACPQVFSEL